MRLLSEQDDFITQFLPVW